MKYPTDYRTRDPEPSVWRAIVALLIIAFVCILCVAVGVVWMVKA